VRSIQEIGEGTVEVMGLQAFPTIVIDGADVTFRGSVQQRNTIFLQTNSKNISRLFCVVVLRCTVAHCWPNPILSKSGWR